MRPRIGIIGGGISGLAAAYRLAKHEPSPDIVLLEAANRLGGVLETTRRDGFLIETAADNFLTRPTAAIDLCREIGLDDELLGTAPSHRQAFVVYRGRLRPIPAGFLVMAPSRVWPMLTTRILSLRGKLRMGLEYFRRRRPDEDDESLASFVRRRFGREIFERLVQPLVGGIYTADAEMLSVRATMPRFCEMEREHRSLIRAMLRQRRENEKEKDGSGARYGQFAAPRNGMRSLVEALSRRLPRGCVRLNSPVEWIVPLEDGGWLLHIGGQGSGSLELNGLVIATPAHKTSDLLSNVDAEIAQQLGAIEHASCAVVSLGYQRDQISHPLNGFGFVVPLVAQRTILSCSFSSVKYPGRAPDDAVLFRVFIGGACQSGLLRLPNEQLIELAERELEDLLQVRGAPLICVVKRHSGAMPQYHVGHQERIATVEKRLDKIPTLALAGNALCGVGVPSCIHSATAAAEKMRRAIGAAPTRRKPREFSGTHH